MPPVGQPRRALQRHGQQVVEHAVFLGHDDQVGTHHGGARVLPHQALTKGITARRMNGPGQPPAVVLAQFRRGRVAVHQHELDALSVQPVAQLLEQGHAVVRQPALHAHHPGPAHKAGLCRRRAASGLQGGVNEAGCGVVEAIGRHRQACAFGQARVQGIVGQYRRSAIHPQGQVQRQHAATETVSHQFTHGACMGRRQHGHAGQAGLVGHDTPGVPQRREDEQPGALKPARQFSLRGVARKDHVYPAGQRGGLGAQIGLQRPITQQRQREASVEPLRHAGRHLQGESRVLHRHQPAREQQVDVARARAGVVPRHRGVGAQRREVDVRGRHAVAAHQPPAAMPGGGCSARKSNHDATQCAVDQAQAGLGLHRPVGLDDMRFAVEQRVEEGKQVRRVVAGGHHHVGRVAHQFAPQRRAVVDEAAAACVHGAVQEHMLVGHRGQVPAAVGLTACGVENLQLERPKRRHPVVDGHAVRRRDVGDQGHPQGAPALGCGRVGQNGGRHLRRQRQVLEMLIVLARLSDALALRPAPGDPHQPGHYQQACR